VLVLGAFGLVFSFANYPWFATAVVLLIVLAIGFSERRRRIAQETRRRNRARSSDLRNG
jgi:heme exporter protein D